MGIRPKFDKQYRKGQLVPVEHIDPHQGSMLAYGILEDWVDEKGLSCSRRRSIGATVELLHPLWILGPWDSWAEEHAFIQNPWSDEDYKSPENAAARMGNN